GGDDMPSHIRAVLTCTNLCIPFVKGKLDLGIWQEVYLWEHRIASHSRELTTILFF
ncbi:MAG: YjbQ family protein, partial [Legionellales bacterium]|nr:YjbQ family protein [Legionellales bacterium]